MFCCHSWSRRATIRPSFSGVAAIATLKPDGSAQPSNDGEPYRGANTVPTQKKPIGDEITKSQG